VWEEFLYSQGSDGGPEPVAAGRRAAVEQTAMTSNGSIDKAAASKLPAVSGTPAVPDQGQNTSAASYLATNWAKAVG